MNVSTLYYNQMETRLGLYYVKATGNKEDLYLTDRFKNINLRLLSYISKHSFISMKITQKKSFLFSIEKH